MSYEVEQALLNTKMAPKVRAFVKTLPDWEALVFLNRVDLDGLEDHDAAYRALLEVAEHGWQAYGPFRNFENDANLYWDYIWAEDYIGSDYPSFLHFLAAYTDSVHGFDPASPHGIDELVLGLAFELACARVADQIQNHDWEDEEEEVF